MPDNPLYLILNSLNMAKSNLSARHKAIPILLQSHLLKRLNSFICPFLMYFGSVGWGKYLAEGSAPDLNLSKLLALGLSRQ
jgi:hypothetical protein